MDDASRRRQEDWERSLQAWKAKHGKEDKAISSVIIDHNKLSHKEKRDSSILTSFLIVLAFAIPIIILGYALYINYLPLGYEKTYTLTIDQDGIISPLSNEIYLTNAQGKKLLSLKDGVQGQVNVVLEPDVVLKNATISADVQGENVFIATPLEVDLESLNWEHSWDFSKEIKDFNGTATYSEEEKCTHFNAYNEQILSLDNSKDLFESGRMSIYARWKPSQISALGGNNQQIIGHFNWELWQSEKNVQFRVGRMNDANGTSYSITYPIKDDFFNKEHKALAIYNPDSDGNGYIELWIDDKIAGRTAIGKDIIYRGYGDKDLSLGWSSHNYGNNPYFDGCIYKVAIGNSISSEGKTEGTLNSINGKAILPIVGSGSISQINIKVTQ